MNDLSNSFAEALVAKRAASYIPKEDNFYEFLIGEWDITWIYNKNTERETKINGKWYFSWIIQGQAIQDVFMCPSCFGKSGNEKPTHEYGTSLRIYSPNRKSWDILYCCKECIIQFEGKKAGNTIVQTCINESSIKMKWIFSQIKENSFHWQNIISKDNGESWIVQSELYAEKCI